jgi:hypothetical protein
MGKPVASAIDNSELGSTASRGVEDHEGVGSINDGFAGEFCHYSKADFVAAVWASTDKTASISCEVRAYRSHFKDYVSIAYYSDLD